MIELINDELGTHIEPKYIENPLAEYVNDTMADYSKSHEATGWEATISFEEGVSRVCESYQRHPTRRKQ
ncbi:hypothetical protein EXE53_30335 [Halorubrum sp. SD626R]|nr:hypothetical protein EXE53_30335 [Halorubrum sp. SD626R]